MTTLETARRALPSVDEVLRTDEAARSVKEHGRRAVVAAVRAVLASARAAGEAAGSVAEVAALAAAHLQAESHASLQPVFNLTGTILHTNLGRAQIAEAAVEAAVVAMRAAVTLEFDLDSGRRGERDDHLRRLLCELTGAEDATVVNNNAAAVVLVLNTLARGREAIVSRGELIEIGGSFRLPQIMARAGAKLVEVGTTNRTHLGDYANAIGPHTGLLLKVHTSNYRIEEFTKEVAARELAEVARHAGVPLVHDLGSGTLIDLGRFGLPHEPTVSEAAKDGANLVTFSGDKLLGGPQAGVIVGDKALITRLNANPMKRALRVDKIRLAAFEATLRLYRDPDRLAERLPVFRLAARPKADIDTQAARLAPVLAKALGSSFTVNMVACASEIGSGALPTRTIASAGLSIQPRAKGGSALAALGRRLRGLPIPVVGRIEGGAVVLDLRCLEDEAGFAANIAALAGSV